MLRDEIALLKSMMVELDDDNVLLITMQYHVEEGANGKIDRSKSLYRWIGRAMSKAEVESTIARCFEDKNRLTKFTWPGDKLSYYLCIGNGSECYLAGKWLKTKLNKLRSWDYGVKVMNGWSPATKTKPESYNDNAKYVVDGYTCDNGDVISILDREALLKHIGQNFTAPVAQSKASKAPSQV